MAGNDVPCCGPGNVSEANSAPICLRLNTDSFPPRPLPRRPCCRQALRLLSRADGCLLPVPLRRSVEAEAAILGQAAKQPQNGSAPGKGGSGGGGSSGKGKAKRQPQQDTSSEEAMRQLRIDKARLPFQQEALA